MSELDSLVKKLSDGTHPLAASLRPEATVEAFEAAIGRDYVHVLFTGTEGGTELGFPIDDDASNWDDADFDSGTGTVHLEGDLELNFVPVRCVADIDLETLEGEGKLVVQES